MEIDGVEVTSEFLNPEADAIEMDQQISTEPPVTEPAPPATTATEPEQPPQATATGPEPGGADEEPELDPKVKKHLDAIEKKYNAQLNAVHRRLSAMAKKGSIPIPAPVDESKAPKMADFDTIESFEKARDDFEIDRRINAEIRKVAETAQAEAEKSTPEKRQEFVATLWESGKSAYPDFESVLSDKTLPITTDIIDLVGEIGEADTVSPADIFYYLGKNKAELTAISNMTKPLAEKALTRIQGKIEALKVQAPLAAVAPPAQQAKPIKAVTTAPPPITPGDSTVIIHKDPNKMTQREYEEWRKTGGGR